MENKDWMSLLTCHCLNITITTKKELNYRQFEDLQSTHHKFFNQYLAQVSEADIKKEYSYLVHKKQIGEWMVEQCLNCGIETHAASKQSGLVMISPKLHIDAAIIERLRQSSDYSSVFHIVLQGKSANITSQDMPDPSSKSYESLQAELGHIQEQINTFLLQEESSMEERIRQYEEEQRAQFEILQSNIRSEKKKMINLILKSEKPITSEDDESSSSPESQSSPKKSPKKTISRTKSTPLRRLHSVDEYEHTPDSEVMFMLDEPGQEEPFFASDDDDDDESISDDITSPPPTKPSQKRILQYSSSVPISVPRWGHEHEREEDDETDEEPTPSDPDMMAASMQALARSITNDERMIFGDRPRPRLNTGDFKH